VFKSKLVNDSGMQSPFRNVLLNIDSMQIGIESSRDILRSPPHDEYGNYWGGLQSKSDINHMV
jgi:hypothetical protein